MSLTPPNPRGQGFGRWKQGHLVLTCFLLRRVFISVGIVCLCVCLFVCLFVCFLALSAALGLVVMMAASSLRSGYGNSCVLWVCFVMLMLLVSIALAVPGSGTFFGIYIYIFLGGWGRGRDSKSSYTLRFPIIG